MGMFMGIIKIKNFLPSTKFYFLYKFWNPRNNILECPNFYLFIVINEEKEKILIIEIEDGHEAPWKPSFYINRC